MQLGSTAPGGAFDASTLPHDALGPAPLTLKGVQQGLCQSGAPPVPLVELTIAQAHAAMLGGQLNCTGLVAAYLQRILAFDTRLQLNSIRTVNPGVAQVRAAPLLAAACTRFCCCLGVAPMGPLMACAGHHPLSQPAGASASWPSSRPPFSLRAAGCRHGC